MSRDIEDRLAAWIAPRLPGASNVTVEDLRRPGAGESSDTQLFTLRWTLDGQDEALAAVLRCAPTGDAPFPEYDLRMQFGIMQALATQPGVPVPEVLWLEEDDEVLGASFLTMKAVDGEAPLDFPSYHGDGFYFDATPDERRHIWRGTVAALARQHAVDWEQLGLAFVPGGGPGEDPRTAGLEYWRRYLNEWIKQGDPSPIAVFDDALQWLEQNRPEPSRVSLCWGDAKLGNVLYDAESKDVAAIIDWELASIGDPEADLASLQVSDLRAQDSAGVRLDGTPSESELIALYEEASGRRVENFHYQLVYSTFWRGSVALKVMTRMKQQGAEIDDAVFENHFPVRYLRELLERS